MSKENIQESLTDSPLENIKILAPHLSEADQNKVLGLMIGMVVGTDAKKAG